MQAPVTYIVKMKTLTVAFSLNSNKFNFVNKSLSSVKKYAVVQFVLFMSCQDIFHEVDNNLPNPVGITFEMKRHVGGNPGYQFEAFMVGFEGDQLQPTEMPE